MKEAREEWNELIKSEVSQMKWIEVVGRVWPDLGGMGGVGVWSWLKPQDCDNKTQVGEIW